MLRLIKFLITGDWHVHDWETMFTRRRVEGEEEHIVGEIVYLKCKKCGNWKRGKNDDQQPNQ